MVVDLAVGDDVKVLRLVRDRLRAARDVDDRKPPLAEPRAGEPDAALVVGAAMRKAPEHTQELRLVDLSDGRDDAAGDAPLL